jgi:hypothetical protein
MISLADLVLNKEENLILSVVLYCYRYFSGKRRAEEALREAYPQSGAGVVLQPGFMYGTRYVQVPLCSGQGATKNENRSCDSSSVIGLPLGILGKPLDVVHRIASPIMQTLRHQIPGAKAILAPPLAVEDVAKIALAAASGRIDVEFFNRQNDKDRNIVTIEQMQELSSRL